MSNRNDLPRTTDRERDLVGDLVRLADSGPEIPADGAERIKAAVKPEWRRQLRARSRRRWTYAAAGAAAAVVLAVASTALYRSGSVAAPPSGPVALVEVVSGEVEVAGPDGGSTVATRTGPTASIPAGSRLRTRGGSRASLRLADGQSLRLDTDTSIRLASATLAELERGAVYLDSPAAIDVPVVIETPLGAVTEVGTQFEVRMADRSLSVAVREGRVFVSRDDVDLEIGGGAVVTVGEEGLIDRQPISPAASPWDWVQEIAPPFDIEGRSVAEFLEWVSRETGLGIRYSESALEGFARETLLHGTVAGLSPTQAPEVVLATCGLTAERKGETLVIVALGVD